MHWAPVLRDLEAVPAAMIVPGHGPVMTDHAYTRAVRELMEATLTRVEALVRAGRNLAQVQDELNLDDVRARVPEWNGPGVSEEDWVATQARARRARVRGHPGPGRPVRPTARDWNQVASTGVSGLSENSPFALNRCEPSFPLME